MGQPAYHLAQEGQPLSFHHLHLTVLHPLHVFLDIRHIFEYGQKTAYISFYQKRSDFHHEIKSLYLPARRRIQKHCLLVGDLGTRIHAGCEARDQIIHRRFIFHILAL